jgi:hypothetical protein
MNEPSESKPHHRARQHLKKIVRSTAAYTLGTACAAYVPLGCDPVPTPLTCKNNPKTNDYLYSNRLQTQASWQQVDGGVPKVVEVMLHLGGGSDSITFKGDPAVTGATIFGITRTSTDVTFSITPDAGVTQVQLVIEVDCATLPKGLKLGFDVSAPGSGQTVTVTGLD